jgi:tellurite resistance protein TehA-like permease
MGFVVVRCYHFVGMLFLHALCHVRTAFSYVRSDPANNGRMYVHTNQLSTMTAVWLLPIVAPIVASASGSIVASVLPNPQHALWTIVISYILWGTGVPLAMAVLVIYFQRLTLHALPPREVIVSVFLPLGPLGQGGFAIMNLGSVALRIFAKTGTLQSSTTNFAEILYVLGWLVATIMWGFGLVWLFFAAASITRSQFPFNMGWWGFTFPLGVFTITTTQMAKELPSTFFKVLGTVRDLYFLHRDWELG